MTLFTEFPKVEYNDYILTDISKRLIIAKALRYDNNIFQTYVVEGDESAEVIANDFYGSSKLIWLLYLMNEITDPFYGWPMPASTLNLFIADKYSDGGDGIHHYKMDDVVIYNLPVDGFNSVISNPAITISSLIGSARYDVMNGDSSGTGKTAVSGKAHTNSGKYYIEWKVQGTPTDPLPTDVKFGIALTSIERDTLQDYDGTIMNSAPGSNSTRLGISMEFDGTYMNFNENFDGSPAIPTQAILGTDLPDGLPTKNDNFGAVLNLDNMLVKFYQNGKQIGGDVGINASRKYDVFSATATADDSSIQFLDGREQVNFADVDAQTSGTDPVIIENEGLLHWQTDYIHENAFPITNKMYEETINDNKRKIKIIRPKYVPAVLNELANIK